MENELIDKFEELFQSIYGEDAENYYQKKVFLDMNGPGDQIAKDLRIEFHWKENEKIIAAAWDFDRHPTYYNLRRWFTALCEENQICRHNAVAFWNGFLTKRPSISPKVFYKMLFVATVNYGDVFDHALYSAVPVSLIRPDEVENKESELYRESREVLAWYTQSLPELTRSTYLYESFVEEWKGHVQKAKKYLAWKKVYTVKRDVTSNIHSNDIASDLTYLFFQYISFLNEFENSKRYNVEEVRSIYDSGEDSVVFNTMRSLAVQLNSNETVARIAPLYVLLFFKKSAGRLCKAEQANADRDDIDTREEINCTLKLPEITGENRKTVIHFYDRTQSNIKNPQIIAIDMYQKLCAYFEQRQKLFSFHYDSELCDYLLERRIPLVGVKNKPDNEKKLHSLLHSIRNRLENQLFVYPRNGWIICKNGLYKRFDNGNRIAMDLDDTELEDYLQHCIIAPDGVGSSRISKEVKLQWARILDSIVEKRRYSSEKLWEGDYAGAVEANINRQFAEKIQRRYHDKLTIELFRLLYSDAFAEYSEQTYE